MDKDLQKKLKRADLVKTIKCRSFVIGGTIGAIITTILIFYYGMTNSHIINGSTFDKIALCIPGSAVFGFMSFILCGALLASIPALYGFPQDNSLRKELENIREELDSDYQKSHSNLKPSPEEEPKSKVKQQAHLQSQDLSL